MNEQTESMHADHTRREESDTLSDMVNYGKASDRTQGAGVGYFADFAGWPRL